MAVTARAYGAFLGALLSGSINWGTGSGGDTIKVMLVDNTYTPNQDTHDFKNDIIGEVVGTGYAAGGAVLGSKSSSYNSGTNTWTFDAGDTVWPGSTLTARYAILYKDTGVASTSPLIGYVDFGIDVPSTGGPFTITWDSSGIITISTT